VIIGIIIIYKPGYLKHSLITTLVVSRRKEKRDYFFDELSFFSGHDFWETSAASRLCENIPDITLQNSP
jgi:hypothetical protein